MRQTHPPIRTFTVSGHRFDMILVEGGSFSMGMEHDDPDAYGDEQPVHEVTVPGFYLGQMPVTQAFWQALTGNQPAHFAGAQRPVEQVSWDDAQSFIEKLKTETGEAFRLPTEAEWEFAARGGVFALPLGEGRGGAYTGLKYAGSNRLKEVAWYETNSHDETKPAGWKFRNELGLYDMSGNVWEWCEDDWHGNYNGAPEDGSAWIDKPERGINRVIRGGSWALAPRGCRSANRGHWRPGNRYRYLGFRLALSLQSVG